MIVSDDVNEGTQRENLRQTFALLEATLPTEHATFVDVVGNALGLPLDVDPFLFLDIAANGTALEMLQLLAIVPGDITDYMLSAALMIHEDQEMDDEAPDEEWDTAQEAPTEE